MRRCGFCLIYLTPATTTTSPIPMTRLPATFLKLLVRAYQLLLRHWLGLQCRYSLRCSDYALQALDAHGALAGSYLAARRVSRCHPWCAGGDDPVPDMPPRLFQSHPFSNLPKPKPKA